MKIDHEAEGHAPAVGSSGVPSRPACLGLLADRGVPPHIIEHSRIVASLAGALGADLVSHGGLSLDLPLLEAAALLHDIAKADTIGRPLADHAREGGTFLRSLGYPVVASIMEQHIYVTEDDCRLALAEGQVLCYADKRVLHDKVVSLDARYDDLVSRYGTTDRLAAIIEGNRSLALSLERKIFSLLPYPPGELAVR